MPDKAKTRADLVIAGGGIAGLALAALLGRAGLSVHIIDPAPPAPLPQTPVSARTIALMQSSANILTAAGVEGAITEYGTPLKAMRIIDDSASGRETVDIAFPANDIGLEQFGFNIANSILRAALYETVQKIPGITLHMPGALSGFTVENGFVSIRLQNGEKIESSLLVGADGRKSRVREQSGITCKTKDYDQSAITCLIGHSRSHNNTASEFHRAAGPLAFVPLQGKQSAIVWVEHTARADELLALRKNEFLDILQATSKSLLGTLTLDSNPESWPVTYMRADRLTAPRIALIAEAAHVMSPITAQGLNLSLRDVAAVAETVIDSFRVGLDIGSRTTLQKYECRRAADISTRTLGVDRMNSIVSTDLGFLKGLRRAGLKSVGALSPLKKFAMKQGLAPEIDQGRLAKGLPL